jgi:hypothetical protein
MPTAVPDSVQRNNAEATRTEPTTKDSFSSSETMQDIARLAYALWEERGCPEGSAERDWLEAEQKLRESSVG